MVKIQDFKHKMKLDPHQNMMKKKAETKYSQSQWTKSKNDQSIDTL